MESQFAGGFRFRFGQDSRDRHGHAAMPRALVRRFHERENFQGLLRGDGRLSGFEKAANLAAEFLIAAFPAGLRDGFAAVNNGAEIGPVAADSPIGADASASPDA